MLRKIMIDKKIKSKIEQLNSFHNAYSVKFKDIEDTFWFSSIDDVQEFMNIQAKERTYDKVLRNGFFDYINEYNEVLRYTVKATRGNFSILKEENLGDFKK